MSLVLTAGSSRAVHARGPGSNFFFFLIILSSCTASFLFGVEDEHFFFSAGAGVVWNVNEDAFF